MKILLLSILLSVNAFSFHNVTIDSGIDQLKTQQQQKPEKMTLLANPVKDGLLKLNIINVQSETVQVKIINSIGKQVFEAKRSLNKQTQSYDISTLASGIYFLRVSTEQSNFVKKLIVQ